MIGNSKELITPNVLYQCVSNILCLKLIKNWNPN